MASSTALTPLGASAAAPSALPPSALPVCCRSTSPCSSSCSCNAFFSPSPAAALFPACAATLAAATLAAAALTPSAPPLPSLSPPLHLSSSLACCPLQIHFVKTILSQRHCHRHRHHQNLQLVVGIHQETALSRLLPSLFEMLRKIFSLKCQKYVKIFCADTQNTKSEKEKGRERTAEKANEMFENEKRFLFV